MWASLIPMLGSIVDKLLPDPAAAAEAKLKIMQMAQTGELAQLTADTELAKGQMEVNRVEAASTSLFVSGWRPFVGWICGIAMGFKYIGGPLLTMVAQIVGHPIELPVIDSSELWPILLGMLGLGAYRTAEKIKDKA